MTFHPHTAIPTTQPLQRSSYEQREYPDNKPLINMKMLRSLLSDIIEVIDTLESLKSKPRQDSNQYVPKFMTPDDANEQTAQSEFAQKVAEALEEAQLGEVENVSGDGITIHTYTPDTSCADQDPEENAQQQSHATEEHQAAMFTPEAEETPAEVHAEQVIQDVAEPEPAPTKTRKPRSSASRGAEGRTPKAPKPEPVDIAAVRQEIATAISQLVEAGGKDRIKTLLASYGVDRARELGDDKVENFLADISTL